MTWEGLDWLDEALTKVSSHIKNQPVEGVFYRQDFGKRWPFQPRLALQASDPSGQHTSAATNVGHSCRTQASLALTLQTARPCRGSLRGAGKARSPKGGKNKLASAWPWSPWPQLPGLPGLASLAHPKPPGLAWPPWPRSFIKPLRAL